MRALTTLFIASLLVAVRTHASEWSTFSINENPVPPSALVSFSVGYPKGWRVYEDPSQQRQDIYFDTIWPPSNSQIICSFEMVQTNQLPSNQVMFYAVWRSGGSSSKEAAEKFLAHIRSDGMHQDGRLCAVTTHAGETGWLVESKEYVLMNTNVISISDLSQRKERLASGKKVRVVSADFFFRSKSLGNKEGIRIDIMTNAADSSRHAQLSQLVLQTLCFTEAGK